MLNETTLLILGIGIGLFCVLLLGYFYLKEHDHAKRFHRYEKSIEDLNKEVYRLQKKIKEQEEGLEKFKVIIKQQIYQDARMEMKNLLDLHTASHIEPIKSQMELFGRDWQDYKEGIEAKLLSIEERIKEFVYTPSSPTNIDEGRIISMFKDGWSVDSIAKELRIGKGEVEFTLKFANLE